MRLFPGLTELPLCENFHPKDKQFERECPPRYTGCLTQTSGKPDEGRAYRPRVRSKSYGTGRRGMSLAAQTELFRKRLKAVIEPTTLSR